MKLSIGSGLVSRSEEGVELRVDVLHVKLPLGSQLTHLEVTTVDVARPVARLAVAGELHGTRVVDVDEGDSSIL